jgi:predicted phosphoadenosine phosphosulfate sulfurtransferase
MLHLMADEARKRGRKFGVLLVDLEGQYRLTIDHAEAMLDEYADVIDEEHWVCLPMSLRNAVSVYEPKWQCWDPDQQEAWIRQPPKRAITDPEHLPVVPPGHGVRGVHVPLFGEHYARGERTACLVGIRADESLNRFRTIASTTKTTLGRAAVDIRSPTTSTTCTRSTTGRSPTSGPTTGSSPRSGTTSCTTACTSPG